MKYPILLVLLIAVQGATAADKPTTAPATQPVLQILSARFGTGNRWLDVTAEIQKRVKGDRLDMPVNAEQFPTDPAPRVRKSLEITYLLNGEKHSATFQGQTQAWIAPYSREEAQRIDQAAPARSPRTGGPLQIVSAKYGNGNRTKDVVQNLQEIIWKNSLTVKVGDAAFGDPAPGTSRKELRITYDDGSGPVTRTIPGGQTLQIGPVEVPTLERGKLVCLPPLLEKLQEKLGKNALIVLDARYGTGNRWSDVTEALQRQVHGKGLAAYVGRETFGDPLPGQMGKNLEVWYWDGQDIKFRTAPEGRPVALGDAKPEDAPMPGEIAERGSGAADKAEGSLLAEVETLRQKYGDGLLILRAQFGAGNRWQDVRDRLQQQIAANVLMTRSRIEDWGDPAPGSTKEIRIAYWNGREIKHATVGDGALFTLEGVKPQALSSLKPLPQFVIEGQKITHDFGGKGRFTLTAGPRGSALTPDGKLQWTPAADQVGGQQVRFSYKDTEKEYYDTQWCEVVAASVAAPVHGDLKKLESFMQLPITAARDFSYAPDYDGHDSLLLEGNRLTIVDADGTVPLRTVQLEHSYVRIAQRDKYFAAIRVDPMAEDLIDPRSGKVIKTVPLVYRDLKDVAFMPNAPFTFISVAARPTIPRDQIIIINETAGQAIAPRDLAGTFLQFDRSGKHLWVGIKDMYQNGTSYHINPDWNIIEIPHFGNIDMLLRFDVGAGEIALKQVIEEAGGNGFGIRVAPDGSRASYLSFSGFPMGSKTIPSWNAMNFSLEPVGYHVSSEVHALAFHPVLPLVAVPQLSGFALFGRDNGEPDTAHAKLPAAALAGAQVNDVFFSADGLNLILACEKGNMRRLYKVPLNLTPAERGTISAGLTRKPPPASGPALLRAQAPTNPPRLRFES